ncbi:MULTISPECIES: hypothetical protein [Novosphingobium]|nr:hypothetical protein [Novosphingobium percolationis]
MTAIRSLSAHLATAAVALALSLTMISGTVSTPATPAFSMEYVA